MKPKQMFFILLGLLTLTIVAGLYFYMSAHRALGEKLNELEIATSDIVLAREKVAKLEELEGQFEKLQPLIKKGDDILPPEKEQAEALAVLNKLVTNSGLSVKSITFERTSGLPTDISQTQKSNLANVLVMPVNIQTSSGTYAQLQKLLLSIENNVRHMQVKNLDIARTQDDSLAFSIKVDTYLTK